MPKHFSCYITIHDPNGRGAISNPWSEDLKSKPAQATPQA